MKFINSIITLLTTSIVFGNEYTEEEKIQITDLCLQELEPYQSCEDFFIGITESNLATRCRNFESNNCFDFYDKNSLHAPNCLKAKQGFDFKPDILINKEYKASVIRMLCLKDYDGSVCEGSKLYINNITDQNKVLKSLEVNCKSKKCSTAYYRYLYQTKYVNDFDSDTKLMAENYMNYILSDECQSKFGEKVVEKCGPEYGGCLDGCCSKYGYCGDTQGHCGNGCQKEYSQYCDYQIPVSTVPGRCGPEYGKCAKAGECCSQYGYCGTTDTHCVTDCQAMYGVCEDSNIEVSISSERCGYQYGKCPGANDCCSKYDYCGTTDTYCGTGCQNKYGICKDTAIPVSTVSGRCGPGYGKCTKDNQCCSKYNYCGTSTDHCGTGCQPQYGLCN